MSRISDVGGMQGFPPFTPEPDEPPFHADWEAHVFAINRALLGHGIYNLDEFRDAVERMPPERYLAASYYERWLHAISSLLVAKGVLTADDLTTDDPATADDHTREHRAPGGRADRRDAAAGPAVPDSAGRQADG